MKKSRITIIANGFQQDYIYHLVNALATEDVRVNFIGSNIYEADRFNEYIRFYQVRKEDNAVKSRVRKAGWVLQYFLWYLGYLIRQKPHVIHIQWLRFNFIDGVFFPLFARILGHRVVYTAHDVIPHDKDTAYNRMLFKWVYRVQHALIVHTRFIQHRIRDEFNIPEYKIHIIRHGVYEVDHLEQPDARTCRDRFGFSEGDLVLLFFGIITHYKGLDLLLESARQLQDELDVPLKVLVAGRVQTGYEDAMKSLQEKYMGEAYHYILRFIDEEEVPLLFGAADLTALPYREASQSGVMFMSYAYGAPVIAPGLGGFPDDVEEAETGFLFSPGEVDSLKEAIRNAWTTWGVKNDAHRKRIRQWTRERYRWDAGAEALKKIYFNPESRPGSNTTKKETTHE